RRLRGEMYEAQSATQGRLDIATEPVQRIKLIARLGMDRVHLVAVQEIEDHVLLQSRPKQSRRRTTRLWNRSWTNRSSSKRCRPYGCWLALSMTTPSSTSIGTGRTSTVEMRTTCRAVTV